MATDVVPVSFPYKPNGGWTHDEIWGTTGGPAPDGVPDGTPAEVKRRLAQTLIAGADTLLAALQSRVIPMGQIPSGERAGVGVPDVDSPPIQVTGKAREITTAGMLFLFMIGGLLFINLFRDSRAARA
jgi:hypothetical protein